MSSPLPKNDAVLTVCHRMQYAALYPLLHSLRLTGFSGETVVFASLLNKQTIWKLRQYNCDIHPFLFLNRHVRQKLARPWCLWRTLFSIPQPQFCRDFLSRRVLHLFYLRHLLYLRFLESNPQIERVLMCDARDVYFQSDPFKNWPGPGLHAFEEDRSIKIGDCPHHKRWISTLQDEDTFMRLREFPRVCAGTIMADRDSAMAFLREMAQMTYAAQSLDPHDGDQGLFNILVHNRRIPNIQVHMNGESSVFTIGGMPNENIRTDSDGFVVNKEGNRIPILHQYDRKPEIAGPLLQKLRI